MKLLTILLAFCAACGSPSALAQPPSTARDTREVRPVLSNALELYTELHQHPELSFHETQTAARLAAALRALGFDVTEQVGGTGVVAILKNGAGPTVMLRTELDALPVEEKTGLPYASTVRMKDDAGNDVPVMHACGHDLHIASLVGAATVLANSKSTWHGTLMFIGQPAEERLAGADRMVKDGLFARFPRPDVALAFHVQQRRARRQGVAPRRRDLRELRRAPHHAVRQGGARRDAGYDRSTRWSSPHGRFSRCRPSPRARCGPASWRS